MADRETDGDCSGKASAAADALAALLAAARSTARGACCRSQGTPRARGRPSPPLSNINHKNGQWLGGWVGASLGITGEAAEAYAERKEHTEGYDGGGLLSHCSLDLRAFPPAKEQTWNH